MFLLMQDSHRLVPSHCCLCSALYRGKGYSYEIQDKAKSNFYYHHIFATVTDNIGVLYHRDLSDEWYTGRFLTGYGF